MSADVRDSRAEPASEASPLLAAALSFLLVMALAFLANRLAHASRVWIGRDLLEYPLWAVAFGLLGNLLISLAGVRERLSAAFRTEFFLKTGLVLMGATINFTDILRIGAKGMVQAAFVCIGLELAFGEFAKVGWRPVLVYFLATVVNTGLALVVAYALFS